MTIDETFKIEILENKINNKFWKENRNQKETILQYLDIQHFCNMINNYKHKIKIVKGAKYNKMIVYEYKIIITRDIEIRIAYSFDNKNKIIYIIGLVSLDSGMVKHKFDCLISSCYGV